MSQEALAARLNVSKSLVTSFETGRLIPQDDTAKSIDNIFGTGDEIQDSAKTEREDRHPWMRPWVEHERRALLLRTWQPLLIPGLLQCESYMRAVFAGVHRNTGRIDELVAARLERQAATLDRANPVAFSAVIGEVAFRQAPREIMKEQLEHLVDLGHRPNVRIRMLRDGLGLHAGLGGAFVLATLTDGRHVGYLDNLLAGDVVTAHGDLADTELAWEAVDGLALPVDQSRDMMLRLIDELK